MENPIRVCIGTEQKTQIPYKVLCYSIRKHLNPSYEIAFYSMMGESWIKRESSQGTGFSLQRWYIPEYFLFTGKAIYLDVDMLCFRDISELWNIDTTFKSTKRSSVYCTFQKDKWFEHAPATSCMLIDCDKVKEDWKYTDAKNINEYVELTKDRSNYISLMHAGHVRSINEIPLHWNRFNIYEPNNTSILHYTIEPQQPWYYPKHANKDLWRDYLVECIDLGIISSAEIKAECQKYRPHDSQNRGEGLHPYWLKFVK